MKGLIKLALSGATGWLRQEFGWVILLAIAVALTSVYVAFRHLGADRDQLLAFARQTCAASGQGFDASEQATRNDKGKAVRVKYARGHLCQIHVADLAAFRLQVADVTSETLANARVDHDKRAGADLGASQRDSAARAAAEHSMEEHNGKVAGDDRVDGDWFGAFNDVAGVRRAPH